MNQQDSISKTQTSNSLLHSTQEIVRTLSSLVAELSSQNTALFDAIRIFTLDPRIKSWLSEHDPKALEQAQGAINKVQNWRDKK